MRRASGHKIVALRRFPQGEFTSPEDLKLPWGPAKSLLVAGAQVRVPISELKSWLEEKLAY